MRLIIKPLGAIVIVLALSGSLFALVRGFNRSARSAVAGVAFAKGSTKNLVSEANWKFYTEHGATGTMDKVAASPPETPTLSALHVTVEHRPDRPWNIGISNPLRISFKPNEKVTLHFWARAQKTSTLSVVLQKNTPGFPTYFSKECAVGPDWKEFTAEITTPAVAHYESMMAFHLGYQSGWTEVGGIALER